MGAPERIGNEHQRADALMIAQEEIEHGELLARDWRRSYRAAQSAGRSLCDSSAGLSSCAGRIADDGRIELRIARPAGGRGAWCSGHRRRRCRASRTARCHRDRPAISNANNSSAPSTERAETGHQAAAAIRIASESELEIDELIGRSVLRVRSAAPAGRCPAGRRARALAGASASAMMSWLAGSRNAISGR